MDLTELGSCIEYAEATFAPESETQTWVREQLDARGFPRIEVSALEGRLLAVLAAVHGSRRLLEIGTLGGYSALWLVSLLPPGARLLTLEVDPEHARLAREAFDRAGESGRIELREGAGRDLLRAISPQPPFDLVFIDADKAGYPDYLEETKRLLRPGGLVLGDNSFMDGRIVAPAPAQGGGGTASPDEREDASLAGMREFNRRLAEDPVWEGVIVPIRDGVAVARMRSD